MKITMLKIAALACMFAAASQINGQIPSDNPYTAAFPETGKHWTSRIKWNNRVDALKVPGLVAAGSRVDSARLDSVLQSLSNAGGGVLYFEKGLYYFAGSIRLRSGVVLRGADPVPGKKQPDAPLVYPTRFVFPIMEIDGRGTASAESVKVLPAAAEQKSIFTGLDPERNFGLVNLDINRAVINLRNAPLGQPVDQLKTKELHSRVLLLGLHLNNAAVPDPSIPTAVQSAAGHDWQRWPWKLAGTINLTAGADAVIAGCRVNDQPTDNFRQNDFMTEDGMTFDGFDARYRFSDHPAVAFNYPAGPALKRVKHIEVRGNRFFVSRGNDPVVFAGENVKFIDNQSVEIEEQENVVLDGRVASNKNYNALYGRDDLAKPFDFTTRQGDTIPFRLIEPPRVEAEEKYPLILFLHDYTGRGGDNSNQMRQFVWQLAQPEIQRDHPCFVIAPQLPASEERWKAKFNFAFTWSLQACEDIMDQICEKYPIDLSRIYLVGIDIGADALFDLALNDPGRYAALASFGGYYRFSKQSAGQLSKLPVHLTWGEADEWITREQRRIMTFDLRLNGVSVKTREIPATGKKCWNHLLEDAPDFFQWLFDQRLPARER